MQGNITIIRGHGVNIHTYNAPARAFEVTTHLVELPTQLIAIDAQFGLPHADEVIAYAASLNKPITRLYITHAHPDHYFGTERFSAPTYALPEVIDAIAATGDERAAHNRAQMGEFVPAKATAPQHQVTPGNDTIEGITFEFRTVTDVESAVLLTVAIPAANAIIVQDLVYNGVHAFLAEQHLDGWQQALAAHEQLPYERVLPGHGPIGGKELFGQQAIYLAFAAQALQNASTGEELITALTTRFPEHRGTLLLEIQNHYLFATTAAEH